MDYDILIHNGTVVTANPDFDIIPDGIVGIREGVICLVEPREKVETLPHGAETIDAGNGIVMPGLINTHTHMPMTLFRGLADDLPLDVWLNQHIFPAEDTWIDPDNVRLGTELACAEMLLSGTTSFCGGYFHENEVAETVLSVGVRGVLGQGVIDFPAPGVPDAAKNIEAASAFVKDWTGVSPLIRPSIFCHSPYTCSTGTLKAAKTAAHHQGVLFQIHAAETRVEKNLIDGNGEKTVVQYLAHLGVLDSMTLLVHAVWVDADDIKIIAEKEARISHNPESNMKLASGIAPVHACLKAGIVIGLGTDGCASNNDLDLFQEMDSAAKLHKAHTLDPTVMDAATVLKMATIQGARTIGLGDRVGSLEKGKDADLIIIDTRQPHLIPMYNPVSQIVYAVKGSDVRHVMVAGRWLVRDKQLTTIDRFDVKDRVDALARKIGLRLKAED